MLWILIAGVVVGLLCFTGSRSKQRDSTRELGKGAGHTGGTRYKNRSSTQRADKVKRP